MSSPTPKVSVVIPSYNRRALTARAVKSALAQTFTDFEILVVDDGSRPEEVYVPEPGREGRVRVIRHDPNRGVSAARNTGVREARAPLIAFLDSDDYWLPRRLEQHVPLFEAQPDQDNVLLYSAYYTNADGITTLTSGFALGPGQSIGDYLFLDYGCLHVNTWLARKTLLERLTFDTSLSGPEDWDLLLRLEAAGVRFVHSPEPVAVRHVDLRFDRLTTVPNIPMQTRFLERNAARLQPGAFLVQEAILRELGGPPRGVLASLWFKIGFFASSPRLTPAQRLRLIFRYLSARLRHKARMRLTRRPISAIKGSPPE